MIGELGMTGDRLIAFGWWTFTYVVLAGVVLTFSVMGDCLPGAAGAACRAQSSAFSSWLLVGLVLSYPVITWCFFFSRRSLHSSPRT